MLSSAERWLLATMVVAALVYVVTPSELQRPLGHFLLLLAPVIAAVMAFRAAHRSARGARPTWLLLSLAAACVAAGQAGWIWRQHVLGQPLPFPSLPFFLFVAFHPLYAAGLLASLRRSSLAESRAHMLHDALLAATAVGLALARFVYEPLRDARPWLSEIELGWIMGGQFLAQVSLVAALTVVIWRRTVLPPRATAALVLVALVNGAGNLLQIMGYDPDPANPGDALDLVWLLGWGLFATAGAAASTSESTAWTGRSAEWLGRRLRQVVTLTVAVALVATVADIARHGGGSLPTIALLGALGLLIALRLATAMGAAERGVRQQDELSRTRVLVELSRTLATAPRVDEALARVGAAAMELLRGRRAWLERTGDDAVEVIAYPGGSAWQVAEGRSFGNWLGDRRVGQLLAGPDTPLDGPGGGPLAHRVWVAGASVRFGDRRAGALVVERTDSGFDAAELALLGGLADQAAVAMENARLLDEARAAERDRLQTEKLAGLGQLAAGVAHEINNPLAAIHTAAATLAGDDPGTERHEIVQIIRNEAARAARIVRGMLDFVRPPDFAIDAVDLAELVRTVFADRAGEHARRGVSVSIRLDGLPPVLADRGPLEQVIVNLVTNAEHAMTSAAEPRIDVSGDTEGSTVVVRVRDNGSGIPEEHLSRVFDPFFTTKPLGHGTGLGLSVSYGIMRELGGSIDVESARGTGTTFTLRLPIAANRAATGRAAPAARVGAPESRRILVVEDESSLRTLVSRYLRRLGHTVECADNGRRALELLGNAEFDVVLTDLKMPVLDGEEFFEELCRTNPAVARRIVFVSGDTVADETREFLARSGRPFIAKPFDLDALAALVARVGAGE